MASLAYNPNGLGLGITLTVMLIFSLSFFSPSVGSPLLRGDEDVKQRKLVLGSRPPLCINKCLSCRPCMAALVTSPHQKTASVKGDESYYLLSWKCKCGDKYFQP